MAKSHFKILYLIALSNGEAQAILDVICTRSWSDMSKFIEEMHSEGYLVNGDLTDKAEIFLSDIIPFYRREKVLQGA